MAAFFDRLEQRCKEVDSMLCVGLDPHRQDLEKLGDVSAEGAYTFATNLIDLTKHVAVAYKPNAAFFEALGADGVKALGRGKLRTGNRDEAQKYTYFLRMIVKTNTFLTFLFHSFPPPKHQIVLFFLKTSH